MIGYSTKLVFFCFFIIYPIFSQENLASLKENENNLTRNRTQLGYSTIVRQNDKLELKNVFINLNHRTSGFNSFTKPFTVEWAFEPGINFLYIDDIDINGLGIVPYVKAGPEMILSRNLFLGGNIGLGASLTNYFFIWPFVGVNIYYLIPLDKTLFLEFETGFHTTYTKDYTPYVIYLAVGISIE